MRWSRRHRRRRAADAQELHVVDRIVGPGGKLIDRQRPRLIREAVSKETADEVADMMRVAVERGTGTAAQIPGD